MTWTNKDAFNLRISELHDAFNDYTSVHDTEDKSLTQKVRFDKDSFAIGVDAYISRCVAKNINHFETCVPNNRNNKGRIKEVDGDNMEVTS